MSDGQDPRRRADDGSREQPAVPRATFRSYYGRPVLKPPVWEWRIPAYFFAGGLSAAAFAPGVASYTAALIAQTAVPAWHEARRELPFVYTGSAAASGGAFGMLLAPVAEAGPARRLAIAGTVGELAASQMIDGRSGLVSDACRTGRARRLRQAAEVLNVAGLIGAATVARRSRLGAAASGLALLTGSALQRFGTFEAGVASTKDPKSGPDDRAGPRGAMNRISVVHYLFVPCSSGEPAAEDGGNDEHAEHNVLLADAPEAASNHQKHVMPAHQSECEPWSCGRQPAQQTNSHQGPWLRGWECPYGGNGCRHL